MQDRNGEWRAVADVLTLALKTRPPVERRNSRRNLTDLKLRRDLINDTKGRDKIVLSPSRSGCLLAASRRGSRLLSPISSRSGRSSANESAVSGNSAQSKAASVGTGATSPDNDTPSALRGAPTLWGGYEMSEDDLFSRKSGGSARPSVSDSD
mmetsp:Transcript_19870/g.40182  ORF Transcript_19870/g.40182 Transcript_19870/m.40182 type:complete len:153 (+) Transcript_19870:325-783(+)